MAFEGIKEAGQVIGSTKEIGSLFRQGADDVRMFALAQVERIIVNLDSIRDAIDAQDPRAERTLIPAGLDPNTTETILEARQGYQYLIENFSVVSTGATDVDIFVGTVGDLGFRKRISLAGASRDSREGLNILVPEGSKVSVQVTGAGGAAVNMQFRRDKVEV